MNLGPEALSEVENIPGIFEIIEQAGIEYDLARLDALVPSNLVAQLYGETNIVWSESFRDRVLTGLISFKEYLQEKGRDLIGRLRGVQVKRSYVEEGYVVFSEIHCPKIDGCIAYHKHKTENFDDYFIELKIAGFGGGSGKSVKVGTGWEIPTRGECRQILKPVKVLIEECENSWARFNRFSILEIKGGFYTRLIPADLDQCLIPIQELEWNANWNVSVFDSPYPVPPVKTECLIIVGNQWSHSLLANFGVFSANLKVSTNVLRTMKYEYELTGPRKYYGYHLPRSLGYYWTW